MRVNQAIVNTVVAQYMNALRREQFLIASRYLCKLGNWGIRIVVKDIPKGIVTWYRVNDNETYI